MRTRPQFGRWQEKEISVLWHLPGAGMPSSRSNPRGNFSHVIVLNSFQRANKIYGGRSPPIRGKKDSTRSSSKTEPKQNRVMKSEPVYQDESKMTLPRKVDNSWDILDRVLAAERVSKLSDDLKFQDLDFSSSTVQDDGNATDKRFSRRLPPKGTDRSWAILAKALEKERQSQQQKNLTRKPRAVLKTKRTPGKIFKGCAGGHNSCQEIDPGSTKSPPISSQGKGLEGWKPKELKISIVSPQEKDRLRKLSTGNEVVIPATAYRELENDSISPLISPCISPRISPFVRSILKSYLREEDCILKKNFQIATAFPARKAQFRFRNRRNNECFPHIPSRCERARELDLSSTISSPRRADAQMSRIARALLVDRYVMRKGVLPKVDSPPKVHISDQ